MIQLNSVFRALLLCCFVSFFSCKDDPEPVNSQEEFTTVTLIFKNKNTAVTTEYKAEDKEGDGFTFSKTGPDLKVGQTYVLDIQILNENVTPKELSNPEYNINAEIEDEYDEHIFYFCPSGLTMNIAYSNDSQFIDDNNRPVGLYANEVSNLAAGTGKLKVYLFHEKDKTAGANCANPNLGGGEIDIEIDYDITIVN
jgi:hypothetical protein